MATFVLYTTYLTYPVGKSVNEFILREYASVQYQKFDFAINMVQSAGPTCYLGKCDLIDAYKYVNVRPADWHLLGFRSLLPDSTTQMFFFQTSLPFGLRTSCCEFEKIATAMHYIIESRGVSPCFII